MVKKSRKEWKALAKEWEASSDEWQTSAQIRFGTNMALSEENDAQEDRINDLIEVVELLTVLSNDVLDENEHLTAAAQEDRTALDALTVNYRNICDALGVRDKTIEHWKRRAESAESDLIHNSNVYQIASKSSKQFEFHGWDGSSPINLGATYEGPPSSSDGGRTMHH